DTDDDKHIDLKITDDEETNDEFVHDVEQVNDDKDEEMRNAEVEESGNGDDENTDVAKPNARKTEEVKDDAKKAKLPPTSSNLLISLVLSPVQETSLVALVTTLPLPSVIPIHPIPHQPTTPIPTPPITTDAPTITTVVPKFDALFIVQLRVVKLEKDVSKLKNLDQSGKALDALKSQVPTVIEQYLVSKISDDL
nr:hypothetical protein [Tanacetum cinerariifolium]